MIRSALLALLLAVPSSWAGQKGVQTPTTGAAMRPLPSLPAALAQAGRVQVQAAAVQAPQAALAAAQGQAAQAVAQLTQGKIAADLTLGTLFDKTEASGAPVVAEPPTAAAPSGRRSLSDIKTLKVGTYNVLNLFQKVGKHERAAGGGFEQKSMPVAKEEAMRRAQAQAIKDEDLDVAVLQEVENIQALKDFVRDHLGDAYEARLIEGNDGRGIDVAFIVKKDLPFLLEHRSRKSETWKDPTLGGKEVPLFSRDLTSLVIRAEGRREPLAVLFGTHMKSKRDRPGDPNSEQWRRAQAVRTGEILKEERAALGPNVPLLIAGDFNGDLEHDAALKPIFDAGFVDSLAAAGVPPADRITHTYHPQNGPAQKHQMDGVVVDARWKRLIQGAHVYRYKYPDGTVKPIPDTYKQRSKNPSDHFPVVLHLDFQELLRSQP